MPTRYLSRYTRSSSTAQNPTVADFPSAVTVAKYISPGLGRYDAVLPLAVATSSPAPFVNFHEKTVAGFVPSLSVAEKSTLFGVSPDCNN